jgi:type I restriction enzyme S subunit
MMISSTTGFVDQSTHYQISNAGSSLQNYTFLKQGELSYNHGYSKLRNFGSVFTLRVKEARIPFVYHSFSMPDDESIFFGHYLNCGIFDKDLRRVISSTARMDGLMNISYEEYMGLKVMRPSPSEQKKIGLFLDLVGLTITLHQRKCEKLQSLKKALLEKMFPSGSSLVPALRFKGFTDPWEQRKLGSTTKVTMGQSPDGATYTDNPRDHILVQGNADMENHKVVPRVWTTQVTKTAESGDIILSVRAPVGAVGKTDYDVVLGRGVSGVKGNDFIYQSLLRMDFENCWDSVSTGSTFDSINSGDISNAILYIPGKEEQLLIGRYLSLIDSSIVLHQRECEKLQNLKKALLEKMFA